MWLRKKHKSIPLLRNDCRFNYLKKVIVENLIKLREDLVKMKL